MAVKFTNNAKTTLASSLTNVATSASVVDGSVFPTLGAGEYFYCTFDDGSNNEIVKVTARSGNTLTIVRGVDNTSARAFSSGDSAELRATAGLLTDIQENIAAKSANQTVFSTTTASSATDYDIGIDPGVEANASVFLDGVYQHHDTFSFSGSTLTFDTAPVDGTALEVIVDNLVNLQSSNLTVDTFIAADVGGSPQVDFTLSDAPAAETNLIVFVDGVFQANDTYTISSTTLSMTDGVTADRVITVYVMNPVNIGTPSDGTVTSSKLSGNITMPGDLTVTGDVAFDSPTFVVDNANSRVGIGTASPSTLLDIVGDVNMSANLTVDTSTLHVDATNNRVGIGTTSPASELHVKSSGTSSDTLTIENSTGNGSWRVKEGGSSNALLQGYNASNSETIRLDPTSDTFFNGVNVGIGTTSPNGLISISSGAGTKATIETTRNFTVNRNFQIAVDEYAEGTFTITPSTTLGGSSYTTPIITATAAGNVGIGTESPGSLLEIKGSEPVLTIRDTRSAGGTAWSDSANERLGEIEFWTSDSTGIGPHAVARIRTVNDITAASPSGAITFMTSGYNNGSPTERMRITSSGNLLVGTTNTNPHLFTSGKGVAINHGTFGIDAAADNIVCILNRTGGSNGVILEFKKSAVVVGSISTNANSLPSDRNFKRDIEDLNIGLDLITKLNPVSYNYKIDNEGTPKMYGLIAQDLEQSLEEVGVDKNSVQLLQHKPNDDKKESDYSLDYLKLTPILIKAIQEQQAQIETLKQEIREIREGG